MSGFISIQEFQPYFSMCVTACATLRKTENEHDEFCKTYAAEQEINLQHQHQMLRQVDEILSLRVAAPVYATMALEQLINTVASEALRSLPNTLKHLEKSSLASKFYVIPAILCGRELDSASHAAKSLEDLISTRNYFTHPKGQSWNMSTAQDITAVGQKFEAKHAQRCENARNADKIARAVLIDLAAVDSTETVSRVASEMGIRLKT